MRGEEAGMSDDILYVIGSLDVGGAERHLAYVVPRLDRTRYRATIYTLTYPGALAPGLAAQGIRIVSPPFGFLWKIGRIARAVFLMISLVRLVWLLLRLRPAIVHSFLPLSFIFAGLAGLIAFRPVAVMSRRSLNDYQARRPLVGAVEHFLFRFVSAGLGNSRAVADQLLNEGFAPNRLGVIHNGIDLAAFDTAADSRDAVRRANGCPEPGFVIVALANLIPYKGHADLLRALASIRAELPNGWRLWCIGRDDGIGGELADLADSLSIADHIAWLGQRDDVPELLAAADLFVHASHEEGFSNAVLEAMAAGLASVVTDVGGNAEAVENGVTGLVVPPHNPTAMAVGILDMCRDQERRAAFGKAARYRVETRFSLDRCMRSYHHLYDGLLRQSAAPVSAIIAGSG
jgi:glycosyltransferase involved in cell wall biosynthesis